MAHPVRSIPARLHTLALAAFVACGVAAEPGPIKTESTIKRVTLFNDRARVTRVSVVTVKQGLNIIDVQDVPEQMDDSTVRVSIPDDAFVLQSVEIPREYQSHLNPRELENARKKVEDLRNSIKGLQLQIAASRQIIQSVEKLRIGERPSERDAKPPSLSPGTWEKILAFVEKNQVRHRKLIRDVSAKIEDLEHDLDVAENDRRKLSGYGRKSRKVARIKVQATRGGTAKLHVTYVVHNARWFPAYDIHVNPRTGKVTMSYFALVKQTTGEDWSRAEITMSTAIPAHSADLPQLNKWVITDAPQLPIVSRKKGLSAKAEFRGSLAEKKSISSAHYRKVRQYARRTSKARNQPKAAPQSAARFSQRGYQTRALNDNFANRDVNLKTNSGKLLIGNLIEANSREIVLEGQNKQRITVGLDQVGQIWERRNQQSEAVNWSFISSPYQSAGGFDYRFPAARIETVKTDGKTHRVLLRTVEFEGEKEYFCSPLQSKYAYLLCKAKNTTGTPILSGPANIFLGGDFVGESRIATTADSEELELSLGIDERIRVTRTSSRMAKTVGVLTSYRRTQLDTTIKITNSTEQPIKITVEERIPVSNNSKITVDNYTETLLSETHLDSPAIPVGVHQWTVDVEPGKKQEINCAYALQHPVNMLITHRDGNTPQRNFKQGMPAQIEDALMMEVE